MTTATSPGGSSPKSGNLLRFLALAVVMAGAIGSLGLTLYTGRKNPSMVLMVLFAVWVLSPFAALLIAYRISKRLTHATRMALYGLMLAVTSLSLVGYSGAWTPTGTHTAFVFLVIPLLSLILISVVIPVSQRLSRRLTKSDH